MSLDRLRGSAAALSGAFTVKELEVGAFQGEPFAVAYSAPNDVRPRAWLNTDYPAFVEPVMLERRLVWLAAPERGLFTRFDADRLMTIAGHANPGTTMVEAGWLDRYDAYYYDRDGVLPLPVLRAR